MTTQELVEEGFKHQYNRRPTLSVISTKCKEERILEDVLEDIRNKKIEWR